MARQWYRKAAEHGYAYAQNNLGNLYKDGLGGERDMAEAIAWYEKAAAQGYAAAQVNLGWIYETGTGVAQDYAAALKWYQPAAEAGSALAQLDLAMLYAEGRGVPRDYAVAAVVPAVRRQGQCQGSVQSRLDVRERILLHPKRHGGC